MSFDECTAEARRVRLLFDNFICVYAGFRNMPVFRTDYVGSGSE